MKLIITCRFGEAFIEVFRTMKDRDLILESLLHVNAVQCIAHVAIEESPLGECLALHTTTQSHAVEDHHRPPQNINESHNRTITQPESHIYPHTQTSSDMPKVVLSVTNIAAENKGISKREHHSRLAHSGLRTSCDVSAHRQLGRYCVLLPSLPSHPEQCALQVGEAS